MGHHADEHGAAQQQAGANGDAHLQSKYIRLTKLIARISTTARADARWFA
jgi:hypothetical protein